MTPTPPRSPWAVLASTSLAVFAVFLDTTILFVAFPAIRADFSEVSPSTLSWVLNAYTIVFAALLIPAGRLADRIGRRRTFLAAAVLFTVASMLCGLAPTAGLLVAARILQAVGAAALVPSSLALVLQTFPRSKIPVAVAIWGAVGAVAGAAGPTLGAFVVESFGWRWAFFINLPVGIVSYFVGRRVLPEGREANPGRLPDPLGVVLLAGGLALAAFGIVMTDDWGWTSTSFVATMLSAAALVALFVWRCRIVPNPLLDLALFESASFRWANAGTLAFSIGFTAMFLGNVLFLTQVWGFSIMEAGFAISVGPLIVAATAPFFGRLAARVGQRRLLDARRARLGRGRDAADPAGVHHLRLRRPVPAGRGAHRTRRVALPPPAVVGRGAGAAARPLRLGLRGEPGHSQPRATLGVALVVAFTSDLTPATALDSFKHIWWLLVVSGLSVTALATRLPRHVTAAATPQPVGAMA